MYASGAISSFSQRLHQLPKSGQDLSFFKTEGLSYQQTISGFISGAVSYGEQSSKWNKEFIKRADVCGISDRESVLNLKLIEETFEFLQKQAKINQNHPKNLREIQGRLQSLLREVNKFLDN